MSKKNHFIARFYYNDNHPGLTTGFQIPVMYCTKSEAIDNCRKYICQYNNHYRRKVSAFILYSEVFADYGNPEEAAYNLFPEEAYDED